MSCKRNIKKKSVSLHQAIHSIHQILHMTHGIISHIFFFFFALLILQSRHSWSPRVSAETSLITKVPCAYSREHIALEKRSALERKMERVCTSFTLSFCQARIYRDAWKTKLYGKKRKFGGRERTNVNKRGNLILTHTILFPTEKIWFA